MLPTVCVAVAAVFAPDLQVGALRAEWQQANRAHNRAYGAAKTAADRGRLAALGPKAAAFAERFAAVAAAYPGTPAELDALCFAALRAPDSPAGKKALATLAGGRVARADPAAVLAALEHRDGETLPLAPAMLLCAKRSPDHPQAAELLADVCAAHASDRSDAVPPAFQEAADLIAARHAGSPDVSHFAEALYLYGSPPWAARFEPHLAAVLKKPGRSLVQLTARYAQAAIARSGGVARQAEAETLFRRFVADFPGTTTHRAQSIEKNLRFRALNEIARIERCGLGKPAQEIAGVDLAGEPLTLSEHKGKVVLLVFWASWCGPCLADVPHEKELVAKFAGRPFVVLGVNGDDDTAEADAAVKRAGIPWRSVRSKLPNNKSVSEAWAVGGWPTVYVIDHAGVVRHDRLRGTRLDAPLEALVAAAEAARK